MQYRRKIEEISRTDRVKSESLRRVKVERNILHAIKNRMANWIGHILHTNCLLERFFEGKIEESDENTGKKK